MTSEQISDQLGLINRLSKLFVAVVSDTLDEIHGNQRTNKYLFSPEIRPILPEMKICGNAKTIKAVATTKVEHPLSLDEYRKEKIALAIDSVTKGNVVVYSTSGCKA